MRVLWSAHFSRCVRVASRVAGNQWKCLADDSVFYDKRIQLSDVGRHECMSPDSRLNILEIIHNRIFGTHFWGVDKQTTGESNRSISVKAGPKAVPTNVLSFPEITNLQYHSISHIYFVNIPNQCYSRLQWAPPRRIFYVPPTLRKALAEYKGKMSAPNFASVLPSPLTRFLNFRHQASLGLA